MNNKRIILNGISYSAIAKYSGLFIQLFISAILARLISPSDFGIFAIANVIIVFIEVMSNFGITPAMIQNKTLDQDDNNNIFSLTIYVAIIVSVLFFSSSWGIASFYNSNELVVICHLLTIKVFFTTLNYVPNALLLKNYEFKFIAIWTLIPQIVFGLISVLAAFRGIGIYSLLIVPIFSSIVLFVVSILKNPVKFKFKIRRSSLKKIFTFSVYQFLANSLNYFSRNLDKLIIGRIIGMAPLGYYEKSYRLMLLPIQNITHVITPVLHPVFSNYQNNKQSIIYNYLKILKYMGFIGFPLSVFLAFNANELITIVYGNNWTEAIPVFKILSVSVGFQILLSSTGAIFQSANATKAMFLCEVFSLFIISIGLFISVRYYGNIEAIAIAYVISIFINFLQRFYILFKVLKAHMKIFFQKLAPPILLALILSFEYLVINTSEVAFSLVSNIIIKTCLLIISLFVFLISINEFGIRKLIRRYYIVLFKK